ncbi:hypothetical protein MKX01_004878 [Papaver californicum]|nr:hypothetical protein MKX01_004878 [Papaver californicum]
MCCASMEGLFATVTYFNFGINNIDVSSDFGSPLQYACAFGQDEAVKMLLYYKPNLLFNEVNTPLQASICADPNGGPYGVKALPLAAELGETQINETVSKLDD